MKTVLICTTSINRPDLHKTNIPEWYNWINLLDREIYNLEWFINIDVIEKIDFTYDQTKKNYENIIKNIPITFLKCPENNANFFKACLRIGKKIEKNLVEKNINKDDTIIFWLEDDWKLNKRVALDLDRIITFYMSNLCYINFSYIRNNYLHALAPGLINYNLWKKLHFESWKQQKKKIDPEHCVGRYLLKKFISKYQDLNNISIITKFKKTDNNFFNSKYLNHLKSYYTYDNNVNSNIIKDNYINNGDVKYKFKDIITFYRITCGFCIDIGRDYRNKINLVK